MADTKITALTALTAADPANDVLPIVDVSDTTMAASGTTKKISVNNILGCSGTATLASATITGDLTVDTNVLKVDSTLNRVGIGTASPSETLTVFGSPTVYGDSRFNVGLFDPSSATTGTGSGISMAGYTNGTSVGATFAQIKGIKENSTAGNIAGALVFSTLPNGGTPTERLRIDSSGNLGLGVTPAAWISAVKGFQVGTYGAIGGSSSNINIFGNLYSSPSGLAYLGNGYGTLFQMTNGQYVFYQAGNNTSGAGVLAATTQAMTLDASGNLLVGVTSANANGGVLQLKSGITFPATQVASSDANTLDDYEEGTFTPTVIGSGVAGTGTYTSQNARYTKVGRLVTVEVYINWTAHTGTGNLQLGGLPFSCNPDVYGSATFGFINNIAYVAGTSQLTGYIGVGSTHINLYSNPVGGGTVNAVTMDTSGEIIYSATYTV